MRKNAAVFKEEEKNSFRSQCSGKTKYTKKEAVTKAKLSAKAGRAKQIGYYPCSFCNGWHLTHSV